MSMIEGGGGLSLIDKEDGQTRGVMGVNYDKTAMAWMVGNNW